MKKQKQKISIKYPKKISRAAKSYLSSSSKTMGLFTFFVNLVLSSDYVSYVAKSVWMEKMITKKLHQQN